MYRSQEQIVNQMKKKMDTEPDDDMDWHNVSLDFHDLLQWLCVKYWLQDSIMGRAVYATRKS